MAAMRPVIGVDLDEVLGYFVQALASWHNEVHGTSLSQADFHSYRFSDVWGGSDAEATQKVHDFFESHYFAEIAPVPGALAALQQLRKSFSLVVVTSRQHAIEQATRNWIAKHYPDIFDEIYFGNHWGITGEKISKPDLCQKIGAQVLIDDSLTYAEQCAPQLKHVVLFGEYAWNARPEDQLPKGVTRALNWAQALDILTSLNL